jgi:hypothetical protein
MRNDRVDWAMEKLEIEHSLERIAKVEVMSIESPEVPPIPEITCLRKIKPRAIIFKANNEDFCKVTDLIKTQFPEVEIVYVTTGPVSSILRVAKTIPFEIQNCSTQPHYTIE